jgi:hypothetical protein
MTDYMDTSRRKVIKLLSNAPLLPLAGGGVTAALLSACGGGSTEDASPTAKRMALKLGSTVGASTSVTYADPGLGPDFAAAVTGLNLVEDMTFGSDASPSGSSVGIAIKTLTDLATLFNPLEGVFTSTGGYVRGTGSGTINSELQRYATAFNTGNHVFESGALRLQAVLAGGHYNSYLRGSIVTTLTSNGFFVGAEGASTPTKLVDIGLTIEDLEKIEIGTCITGGSSIGISVVVAKDAGAGTITFEAVSSGIRSAYKGNWHLTFTSFAFARVASNVVNGTTTTIQFKTPVASTVVAGMFAMGVNGEPGYYNDPSAADRARVLSISSDRRSVTFDGPVNFSRTLNVATSAGGNTGDGVLFVPGLTSGQIWSKRSYGPQQDGHQAQALLVEFTMPSMPQFGGIKAFSKATIDAAMASAPGTLWGYWPAVWFFTFKPNGTVSGYTDPWSEVDVLELFTRVSMGQSTWTGNLHNQPYTRQVALGADGITAKNGGTWSGDISKEVLTPNSTALLMPSPIASGTKRSVGVVWTRGKVIHYMDGIAVAESDWPVDTQYPHQLGINLACGSLNLNYAAGLFFPQTDVQATSQYLKIHSVKTWEL